MPGKVSKFTKVLFIIPITVLVLSSGYQAFATFAGLKTYPAPGQLIEVGSHSLHIYCIGQGKPSVVMEAGMSGWSTDWVLVHSEIAKVTRVCAYDRAGYGWSDPGPQPRAARQVATELHTLLEKTGIDDKIMLVGHSLGGLLVQYDASAYPQEIAGIVLIDSVHPEQSSRMEDTARDKYEGNL